MEYPVLPGPAGDHISKLARQQAARAGTRRPSARRQRALQKSTGGYRPCRLSWSFDLTYDRDGIRSGLGDLTVWAGLEGRRCSRCSVILDRQGRPVSLGAVLAGPLKERPVLDCILSQAEPMASDGCSLYTDWRERCRTGFSPSRCYLTEEGAAFWYPWQYLGPACAGIPTFLVPWKLLGDLRRGRP